MGCITTSDDVLIAGQAKLVAGQAKLRESLQDSGKWPTALKCSDNDIGFVKREGDRKRYVADMHAFRNLFDDEKQARIVVKWLHDEGLLNVSKGAKEFHSKRQFGMVLPQNGQRETLPELRIL